jgi:hypothetical protein
VIPGIVMALLVATFVLSVLAVAGVAVLLLRRPEPRLVERHCTREHVKPHEVITKVIPRVPSPPPPATGPAMPGPSHTLPARHRSHDVHYRPGRAS